jgi:hypothetical protein
VAGAPSLRTAVAKGADPGRYADGVVGQQIRDNILHILDKLDHWFSRRSIKVRSALKALSLENRGREARRYDSQSRTRMLDSWGHLPTADREFQRAERPVGQRNIPVLSVALASAFSLDAGTSDENDQLLSKSGPVVGDPPLIF